MKKRVAATATNAKARASSPSKEAGKSAASRRMTKIRQQQKEEDGDLEPEAGSGLWELTPRHVMPSTSFSRHNVQFVGAKRTIAFPLGVHLWTYDIEGNSMSYLCRRFGQERTMLSPVQDGLLTLTEWSNFVGADDDHRRAEVSMIEVRNGGRCYWSVTHPYEGDAACTVLSLSARMVACCVLNPEAKVSKRRRQATYRSAICLWKRGMLKPTATKELGHTVTQLSFCPGDAGLLCASGENYLRLLKVSGNSLVELFLVKPHLEKNYYFTSHLWLSSDTLVAATDTSSLIVIVNGEVRQTIPRAEEGAIECVCRHQDWLLVGTQNGHILIYSRDARYAALLDDDSMDDDEPVSAEQGDEKAATTPAAAAAAATASGGSGGGTGSAAASPDKKTMDGGVPSSAAQASVRRPKQLYTLTRTLFTGVDRPVLDVLTSEDGLALCLLSRHGIVSVDLSELIEFGDHREGQAFFNDVLIPNDHVSLLAVCEQKSLVVAAGSDSTVRVWQDVGDDTTKKLPHRFVAHTLQTPPMALEVHPNGMQLLVGFPTYVGLFHILHDALQLSHRVYLHINKHDPLIIKYAWGGHYIAIASGSSLGLYESTHMTLLTHLQGNLGAITAVEWSQDDQFISTTSADGAIYAWNVLTQNRIQEHVERRFVYHDSVIDWGHKWKALTQTGAHNVADFDVDARLVKMQADKHGRGVILASGDGREHTHLQLIIGDGTKMEVTAADVDLSHTAVTCMVLDIGRKIVVMGTRAGHVMLCQWPLHASPNKLNTAEANVYARYRIHDGAVTSLRLLRRRGCVVTMGDDGHMCTLMLSRATTLGLGHGENRVRRNRRHVTRHAANQHRNGTGSAGSGGSAAAAGSAGGGGRGGGSLYELSDEDVLDGMSKEEKSKYYGDPDLALASLADVEEAIQRNVSHQHEVQALKQEADVTLQRTTDSFNQELRTVRKEMEAVLSEREKTIERLEISVHRHEREKVKWQERMQERIQNKVLEITGHYEDVLQREYDRSERQKEQFSKKVAELETRIHDLEDNYEKELHSRLKEAVEEKAKLKDTVRRLREEMRMHVREYEEAIGEMEAEHDLEVVQLRRERRQEEESARQDRAVMTAEMSSVKKKHDMTQGRISDLEVYSGELENELQRAGTQIEYLRDEWARAKGTLRNQAEELSLKSLELSKLRKDNVTLRNFQHVLEQRIVELEEREAPTHEYLKSVFAKVKEMDAELVQRVQKQKETATSDANKSAQIKDLSKIIMELRLRVARFESKWKAMGTDLGHVIQHTPAPEWNRQILRFYNQHIADRPLHKVQNVTPSVDEGLTAMERQRRHLANKLNTIDHKHHSTLKRQNLQQERAVAQNTFLIKEVNLLRTELRKANLENQDLRAKMLTNANESKLALRQQRSSSRVASSDSEDESAERPAERRASSSSKLPATTSRASVAGGRRRQTAGKLAGKLFVGSTKGLASVAELSAEVNALRQQLAQCTRQSDLQKLEISRLQEGMNAALRLANEQAKEELEEEAERFLEAERMEEEKRQGEHPSSQGWSDADMDQMDVEGLTTSAVGADLTDTKQKKRKKKKKATKRVPSYVRDKTFSRSGKAMRASHHTQSTPALRSSFTTATTTNQNT